jgi:hypothetical protein
MAACVQRAVRLDTGGRQRNEKARRRLRGSTLSMGACDRVHRVDRTRAPGHWSTVCSRAPCKSIGGTVERWEFPRGSQEQMTEIEGVDWG